MMATRWPKIWINMWPILSSHSGIWTLSCALGRKRAFRVAKQFENLRCKDTIPQTAKSKLEHFAHERIKTRVLSSPNINVLACIMSSGFLLGFKFWRLGFSRTWAALSWPLGPWRWWSPVSTRHFPLQLRYQGLQLFHLLVTAPGHAGIGRLWAHYHEIHVRPPKLTALFI